MPRDLLLPQQTVPDEHDPDPDGLRPVSATGQALDDLGLLGHQNPGVNQVLELVIGTPGSAIDELVRQQAVAQQQLLRVSALRPTDVHGQNHAHAVQRVVDAANSIGPHLPPAGEDGVQVDAKQERQEHVEVVRDFAQRVGVDLGRGGRKDNEKSSDARGEQYVGKYLPPYAPPPENRSPAPRLKHCAHVRQLGVVVLDYLQLLVRSDDRNVHEGLPPFQELLQDLFIVGSRCQA
mmetsp:Transcript_75591/g.200785  ORF Transcript_75591/g.200785 Transcript_75591/m.200785 type:complete len:235 (-) Transcript_75591:92-796(-)